jgi:hypothetical protein
VYSCEASIFLRYCIEARVRGSTGPHFHRRDYSTFLTPGDIPGHGGRIVISLDQNSRRERLPTGTYGVPHLVSRFLINERDVRNSAAPPAPCRPKRPAAWTRVGAGRQIIPHRSRYSSLDAIGPTLLDADRARSSIVHHKLEKIVNYSQLIGTVIAIPFSAIITFDKNAVVDSDS